MAKTHKTFLKTILSAAAGCGCGRPETSDAYEPMPMSETVKTNGVGGEKDDGVKAPTVEEDTSASSCTGSWSNDVAGRGICDSVAVVFESDDPYRDFRESMVEMIAEKEMESRDELEELLNCFLDINSPRYHDVIVRAFTDVWDCREESGRVNPSPERL